jgi:hypothetical protein
MNDIMQFPKNEETIFFQKIGQIANSTDTFSVDWDDAWIWAGYSDIRIARLRLWNCFKRSIDFRYIKKGKYQLTFDCFMNFCIMAPTKQGRSLRKRLIADEEEATIYFEKLEDLEIDSLRANGITIIPFPRICPPEYEGFPEELWQWFVRMNDAARMNRLEKLGL